MSRSLSWILTFGLKAEERELIAQASGGFITVASSFLMFEKLVEYSQRRPDAIICSLTPGNLVVILKGTRKFPDMKSYLSNPQRMITAHDVEQLLKAFEISITRPHT